MGRDIAGPVGCIDRSKRRSHKRQSASGSLRIERTQPGCARGGHGFEACVIADYACRETMHGTRHGRFGKQDSITCSALFCSRVPGPVSRFVPGECSCFNGKNRANHAEAAGRGYVFFSPAVSNTPKFNGLRAGNLHRTQHFLIALYLRSSGLVRNVRWRRKELRKRHALRSFSLRS
jgi:hypothetical protein